MISLDGLREIQASLFDACREHVNGGGVCSPVILVFPTAHPHSGAPNVDVDAAIVLEVPEDMEKREFFEIGRACVIASVAHAAMIVTYESWSVRVETHDDVERMRAAKIAPSAHPDRVEDFVSFIELRTGSAVVVRQSFRRDDGRVIFEPEVSRDCRLEDIEGGSAIMIGTNRGNPPPNILADARAVMREVMPEVAFVRDWKRKERARG